MPFLKHKNLLNSELKKHPCRCFFKLNSFKLVNNIFVYFLLSFIRKGTHSKHCDFFVNILCDKRLYFIRINRLYHYFFKTNKSCFFFIFFTVQEG